MLFVYLLLLFTMVPLVELFLLIEVGKIIGTWSAVLLVAATGFFGMMLARTQGLQVLYAIQREIESGSLPGEKLLDGACILVGGVLLFAPGLITDLLGFFLLIPVTRSLLKIAAYRYIKRKMKTGSIHYIN